MTAPVYNPGLNIFQVTLDWRIGSAPTISWVPNLACAFVAVYRSETPTWADAVFLEQLPNTADSFEDVEVSTTDGVPHYWWVIGFDATAAFAGVCGPVAGWQFRSSGSGVNSTIGLNAFPIIIDAQGGGLYRSACTYSFGSCLCINGYQFPQGQPLNPLPDKIGMQIIHSSPGFTAPINSIAATLPGSYSLLAYEASGPEPGTPVPGPGGSGTTTSGGVLNEDPVPVANLILGSSGSPSQVQIAQLHDPNFGSEGFNFASVGGVSTTAQVSYVSPVGGSYNGQGNAGGGGITPPTPLFPNSPPVPSPTPSTPPRGRKRSTSITAFSANRLGQVRYPTYYPVWLPRSPAGDFARYFLDFKNGNYWINGVTGQASDVITGTSQIVSGTGLKFSDMTAPTIIGAPLAYLLSQSWTVVVDVDLSAYSAGFVQFLSLTDSTETNQLGWWIMHANTAEIKGSLFGTGIVGTKTVDTFGPTSPLPNNFKTAMTSVAKTSISICCDSGAVDAASFSNSVLVSANAAWLFTDVGDAGSPTDAIFRSVAIYPPQPDSDLPFLTS